VTLRLRIIAAAGLAVVAAAGGLSFSLRHTGSLPSTTISPTWGVFTDAQWRALGARLDALGLDGSTMKMVTAMPKQDGTPFAVVTAVRGPGHACFVVVRGASAARPICTLRQPLLAFTATDRGVTDVVGLVTRRAETVVASWRTPDGHVVTQGSALLTAPHAYGIGIAFSGVPTLTAYGHGGVALGKVYCASALRGVCGTSAQRRS
jgi:hypothetical protein